MRIHACLTSPLGLGDPGLDPLDRLLLDDVVAMIRQGLAVVAGRRAAAHLDQLGAVFPMRRRAGGGAGDAAGVLGVKDDEVPTPEAAWIEVGNAIHRRGVNETRRPPVERPR